MMPYVLVKWEDEAPPDKLEWLAAVRQALVEEPGSYRVRFRRGRAAGASTRVPF